MVVKMNDISTSGRDGDHRLPPVSVGSHENVRASDVIGIGSVVATDAHELLAIPVCFVRRPTQRAVTGGVSGIDAYNTNTVLLGELNDPCFHLPRCPRGHRLAKILSSVLLFSGLDSLQVLYRDHSHLIPRQLLNRTIDVTFALRTSALLRLASRFLPPYLLADHLHLGTKHLPVGTRHQLVHADIDPKFGSLGLHISVGKIPRS